MGNSVTTRSAKTCGAEGATRLLRLAALAEELGTNRIADEARALAARISEGRFYVACVGQFKRGKSALINALIGQPILPMGFVPVTTVPTVVRFGEAARVRVQARNGSWSDIPVSELKHYVAEEYNPENAKRVMGVEVFVPSPRLSTGMCLVDTPGLGSVFMDNTAATQAFVPHIDAALVVVGADPPLAGEELALIETVAQQVPDLILVLNKADRTTDDERTAAVDFTRRLLEKRLHRPVGPVFEISAAEQLANRGTRRDWGKLVEALAQLVQDSDRQLVRAACERGLDRLREQLLVAMCEEREALERPIEESEQRIGGMQEIIAEAERSMRELGFLLMAEQQRLSDLFVSRHKAFLASVGPLAQQGFQEALPSLRRGFGPSYRRALMREAQQTARRHVLPWLRAEQEEAEKEYRQASARFVQIGNAFLKKLAEAGLPELSRMPHALDPEAGFRSRSEFMFRDLIEIAHPASPLRWLADVILGAAGARRRIENAACEFLDYLLEVNCARAQSDVLNRIQESRSRLEADIRKLLHEVSRITERALTHARKAQAEGASAVQAALARLDRLEGELRDARRLQ